jgi:C-terminal processing protease CtpA/Prc
VDYGAPVLVSHITPDTPAALAIPLINIGDEIVAVNEQSVKRLTHEEIKDIVRSSLDGLVLTLITSRGRWLGGVIFEIV